MGPPKPLKVVLIGDSYAAGNGARDVVGTPTSRRITCDNGSGYDALDETTSSQSGLTHAPGTDGYTYVWNTPGT